MPGIHRLGPETFDLWDGVTPPLPHQRILTFTRPGLNGVGLQKLGSWGSPFEAILTADFPDYISALVKINAYRNLVGLGQLTVIYHGIDLLSTFGVQFSVEQYETVRVQAAVLIGPGYAYPNGGRIVGRFVLIPHAV